MFDGFSDKEKEQNDYKLPVLGFAQVSTKFHKNCVCECVFVKLTFNSL